MVIKSVDKVAAKEYLQYLFEVGTFGLDYIRVELENCSAMDETLILNVNCYKDSFSESVGIACYPLMTDFESFKIKVIREEKLDDLLN